MAQELTWRCLFCCTHCCYWYHCYYSSSEYVARGLPLAPASCDDDSEEEESSSESDDDDNESFVSAGTVNIHFI